MPPTAWNGFSTRSSLYASSLIFRWTCMARRVLVMSWTRVKCSPQPSFGWISILCSGRAVLFPGALCSCPKALLELSRYRLRWCLPLNCCCWWAFSCPPTWKDLNLMRRVCASAWTFILSLWKRQFSCLLLPYPVLCLLAVPRTQLPYPCFMTRLPLPP